MSSHFLYRPTFPLFFYTMSLSPAFIDPTLLGPVQPHPAEPSRPSSKAPSDSAPQEPPTTTIPAPTQSSQLRQTNSSSHLNPNSPESPPLKPSPSESSSSLPPQAEKKKRKKKKTQTIKNMKKIVNKDQYTTFIDHGCTLDQQQYPLYPNGETVFV